MGQAPVERVNFRPSVLVEEVAETLAKAILEGVFKGGEQLVEMKLQRQFGISRSPLREAFRVLEKKGLVVIVPRKGTFVKAITPKDIEDNFPVRAVLEGLAAREAHARMTSEHLETLEKCLDGMREAAKKQDPMEYMEHHIRFHETFIEASGNQVLIKLLTNLRMHSLWHRFSYKYYKEDFHKSLAVHQEILDLFKDQGADKQELEKVVRDHIQVALGRFLAYLDEQSPVPRGRERESNNQAERS